MKSRALRACLSCREWAMLRRRPRKPSRSRGPGGTRGGCRPPASLSRSPGAPGPRCGGRGVPGKQPALRRDRGRASVGDGGAPGCMARRRERVPPPGVSLLPPGLPLTGRGPTTEGLGFIIGGQGSVSSRRGCLHRDRGWGPGQPGGRELAPGLGAAGAAGTGRLQAEGAAPLTECQPGTRPLAPGCGLTAAPPEPPQGRTPTDCGLYRARRWPRVGSEQRAGAPPAVASGSARSVTFTPAPLTHSPDCPSTIKPWAHGVSPLNQRR